MHPFFLSSPCSALWGWPGRPVAPSPWRTGQTRLPMALCARRSRGCRAASWRRNPRGTSPGLLLTTSPSPGGLTVAASGVSKPGRSSAAARSERSSPGCGPWWVDGIGPGGRGVCAIGPRCGCPTSRSACGRRAGGLQRPTPDRVPAPSARGAAEGVGGGVGEMLRAAGRCRVHPQRPASGCWRLQAPPPGKGPSWWDQARQGFTWGDDTAELYFRARKGQASAECP